MGNFTVHSPLPDTYTLISNRFIDNYLPDANGEFVKIYLYLLRHAGNADAQLALSTIADTFDCTEKDILRGLKYWKKVDVLDIAFNSLGELTDLSFLPLTKSAKKEPEKAASAFSSASVGSLESAAAKNPSLRNASERKNLSPAKIKKLKENDEIVQLLFIAEQYLGKTLTLTETESLLYFYEELHFSADLLEYLIEYCVSRGKRSMHYIESVAFAWAEQNVTTVAQAKEHSSAYQKDYFTILHAYGIHNRAPIDAEIKYMDLWMNQYGFTLDIVCEACSRTILATNQPNFAYTDSILKSWMKKNVHHLSDVHLLDDARRQAKQKPASSPKQPASSSSNKFNNFHQRAYNVDELERQLLNQ